MARFEWGLLGAMVLVCGETAADDSAYNRGVDAAGKPLTAWSLVELWPRFPAWYHVVFLASLLVFTPLGALRRQR